MSVKNRIIKLRDIINDHNFKYYVLDEPVISDSEYDAIFKELENLERSNPSFFEEENDSDPV